MPSDNVSTAYEQIRTRIVDGRLPPGVRLVEREIADHLDVSRSPVRTALHRLQQEGFVLASGCGVRSRLIVSPLTMEDACELYQIVGFLDGVAAARAAGLEAGLRTALIHELKRVNADLRQAAEDATFRPNRVYELHTAFHHTYMRTLDTPRMKALYEANRPQTQRYRHVYSSVHMGQLEHSIDEHDSIIDAIQQGDQIGARRQAQRNWARAAERIAEIIQIAGERGTW
jgi:DNA-binding GntR family transcriptional regulator